MSNSEEGLGWLSVHTTMRLPLTRQREALYIRTRPASALATLGIGAASHLAVRPAPPPPKASANIERLFLLPMAAAGAVGVAAVLQRRGGFAWLSHRYEIVAWICAFGGVSGAAALSAAGVTSVDSSPLLSVSAAGALAATAGERLGSLVGRRVLMPLVVGGAASSWLAAGGEARPERSALGIALVGLPLLHLCPPVFTLSSHGLVSYMWFWAATCALSVEDPPAPSAFCLSHALIAAGTLSLLRVGLLRRPICQY